jgi:hypothetical protein
VTMCDRSNPSGVIKCTPAGTGRELGALAHIKSFMGLRHGEETAYRARMGDTQRGFVKEVVSHAVPAG